MDFSEVYPDTCSSMALAARRGDLAALRRLTQAGKSCETADNRGWRPVHEAAYWNRVDCLSFLIREGGAELDPQTFEGETPLFIAAKQNSVEAVQVLLEAKALVNVGNHEEVTPLHCAASKGFRRVSELLIGSGANVNMVDCGGYTPLHEASIAGHDGVVGLLLANGADKWARDSHGRTALFCGCQSHSCRAVRLLSSEPDSTPDRINLRASDGATALMLAAQSGCLDCVRRLVEECGGDPSLRANDSVMAVHLALTGGHLGVLRYLLEATDHLAIQQACLAPLHSHRSGGAWSPRQGSEESVNIFTLAVTYGRLDLIQVLLDGGLEPDRFPSVLAWDSPLAGRFQLVPPASFIASFQPFTEESLEAIKRLTTGSPSSSCPRLFVPPVLALCSAPGWQNPAEESVLIRALDSLLDRSETLPDWLHFALVLNPKAFLRILRAGYPVDEKILAEAARTIRPTASKEHLEAFEALSAAGFPNALSKDPTNPLPSLKQLARKGVMACLARRVPFLPVSKISLSLPRSLMDYLCYDDVQL